MKIPYRQMCPPVYINPHYKLLLFQLQSQLPYKDDCKYSNTNVNEVIQLTLALRRTPWGPALTVCLREVSGLCKAEHVHKEYKSCSTCT